MGLLVVDVFEEFGGVGAEAGGVAVDRGGGDAGGAGAEFLNHDVVPLCPGGRELRMMLAGAVGGDLVQVVGELQPGVAWAKSVGATCPSAASATCGHERGKVVVRS